MSPYAARCGEPLYSSTNIHEVRVFLVLRSRNGAPVGSQALQICLLYLGLPNLNSLNDVDHLGCREQHRIRISLALRWWEETPQRPHLANPISRKEVHEG